MGDTTYDVIVIGSGGAGMAAALAAGANGSKVCLIEAADSYGGTTACSGGCMWIPANHRMAETGIDDSLEEGRTYLKALTRGSVSDKIIDTYLNTAPEMLRFIEQATDAKYYACGKYTDYYPETEGGKPGGRTVEPDYFDRRKLGADAATLREPQSMTLIFGRISANAREAHTLLTGGVRGVLFATAKILGYFLGILWRQHRGRDTRLALGNGMSAALRYGMQRLNIPLVLNTRLTDIVIEGGKVTGVVVDGPAGTSTLLARKGVILAAGGFSRNQEMKAKYHGGATHADWGAAVDEDLGDPITIAMKHNAATDMMDEAWWMPVTRVPGEGYARSIVFERSLAGCLCVDQRGQRFANESSPYENFVQDMRRNAAAHGSDGKYWLILDAEHRRKFPLGPLLPGLYFPKIFWPRGLADTWLYSARSIAELESKIGLPPLSLQDTVTRFNQYAQTGNDPDWHRGESNYDKYYSDPTVKPNPNLRALLKGPFYAIPIYPGDLGTKGGLTVDEHARVLDTSGTPIEGLYAAGNTTANPLGNIYPGAGGTLGPGLTFGYIAGIHAAKL